MSLVPLLRDNEMEDPWTESVPEHGHPSLVEQFGKALSHVSAVAVVALVMGVFSILLAVVALIVPFFRGGP
jgi:hypothetical protein